MTPEEREERRIQRQADREFRATLAASSLGTDAVQQVIAEGKRRQDGNATMTDKEWLALIDKSLE